MAEEIMSERELKKALNAETVSTEVAVRESVFTSDELANITSWDDLTDLFAAHDVETYVAELSLGNGFTVASREDKGRLQGVPLVFLEWRFNKGTMGEFCSALVIEKTGPASTDIRKWIVNDGSTGICKQLKALTENYGVTSGLVAKHGLKESVYTIEDPKTGVEMSASTMYINTSA